MASVFFAFTWVISLLVQNVDKILFCYQWENIRCDLSPTCLQDKCQIFSDIPQNLVLIRICFYCSEWQTLYWFKTLR